MLCTTVAYGPDSAAVAFTDKVVDIPVLALRTGGASDSVIDRVQRQFGAVKGFLTHFASFFALLRVVPELSASFSSLRR